MKLRCDTTALNTVPALEAFGLKLLQKHEPGCCPFRLYSLARQVADALDSPKLVRRVRELAEFYRDDVVDDTTAALYLLATKEDYRSLAHLLANEDALGFYCALRLAEDAHRRGDKELMKHARERVMLLPVVQWDMNTVWEAEFVSILYDDQQWGEEVRHRYMANFEVMTPEHRSRAMIDIWRLKAGMPISGRDWR